MARRTVASYQQVQMKTAGPGQRVVMMYDGIINCLKIAEDGCTSDDPDVIADVHNQLQLAQRLITELQLALDLNRGGELAVGLNDLYIFWTTQLSDANATKDANIIHDILLIVADLRETWDEAARKARALQPA